ncbi:MAG: hypothetical protein QM302_04040 [Acidobacteriota bacterium]|nr:hypothetical protein [Acidobacteriota bacterium]
MLGLVLGGKPGTRTGLKRPGHGQSVIFLPLTNPVFIGFSLSSAHADRFDPDDGYRIGRRLVLERRHGRFEAVKAK